MNRSYFHLYFTLNASWTWIPASVYPSCRWLNVLGNVRTMFLDIKWSRASLFSWSCKRWLSHNSWSQSISDPYMWPILYGSYRQDHIVYSPNNMDYKRTGSPPYQNLYSILATVPSWYSHHTGEYFHFFSSRSRLSYQTGIERQFSFSCKWEKGMNWILKS